MTTVSRVLMYLIFATASILIAILLVLGAPTNARPVTKVAVIDSGFSPMPYDNTNSRLCKEGHFDFTTMTETLGPDDMGHGAFVTRLISNTARRRDVCFIIYKVFGPGGSYNNLKYALTMAEKQGVKFANLSLGMYVNDPDLERVIRRVTKNGMKLFVSAGNDSTNLNDFCNIYPQCYKDIGRNLVIVGALDEFRTRAKYSNYGMRVDIYEDGSLGHLRGTSFSAPRALGLYLRGQR